MTREKVAPEGTKGRDIGDGLKLSPARSEVKEFLGAFGRARPTLSFKGERGFITRVYPNIAAAAGAAVWFNRREFDVYFVGNSHRMIPDEKRCITKPKKMDIELCVGAWLDVDGVGDDPAVISDLCRYLDWGPTYIVASGGGLQAFWRFDEFLTDRRDAEAINYWLVHEFGALLGWDTGSGGVDKACWTVEHLWRLPGTVNHKHGRKARVVQADWSSRLPVLEAGRRERVVAGSEFHAGDHSWVTEEWMREVIPPYVLDHLWSDGLDRSAHVYRFLRLYFGALGTNPDFQSAAVAILQIETDDPRFVSHHSHFAKDQKSGAFVPRSDPEAEATRQVQKWIEKEACNA